MKKEDLEKNCLDLAYKRKMQLLQAIYLFASGSLINLFASFIWYRERWFLGAVVSVVILLISYFWHIRIDAELKEISQKIRNLKGQA